MNSSQTLPSDDVAELERLLGLPVESSPNFVPTDVAVAVATGQIRGQLISAANDLGVGVREWARRLNVSPAAVSRQLRSEADLRVSTAVAMADALGLQWAFLLYDKSRFARTNSTYGWGGLVYNYGRAYVVIPPITGTASYVAEAVTY